MEVSRSFELKSPDQAQILKSDGFKVKIVDLSSPFPVSRIQTDADLNNYRNLSWGAFMIREKGLAFLFFENENMKKRMQSGKSSLMSEIGSEIKYSIAREVIPFGGVILSLAELGISALRRKSKLDIKGALAHQESIVIPINEVRSFNCYQSKNGKRNSVVLDIGWEKDDSSIVHHLFYTEDKLISQIFNVLPNVYFLQRWGHEVSSAKEQALIRCLGDQYDLWQKEVESAILKLKGQKHVENQLKDLQKQYVEKLKEYIKKAEINEKELLTEALQKTHYWLPYVKGESGFSSLPKYYENLELKGQS